MRKNLMYQWSYQILSILLPFITTPYVSRTLGVDNIGVFTYNYTIVNYFMIFAMLGVNVYGNRKIAQVKDELNKLHTTFSEIFYAQIIVSSIATVIYIFYALLLSDSTTIAIVQIIYMIGCMFDINWFYFGLEEFKVTVLRNFIVKIFTVCAIFLFIHNSDDLLKYVFIMTIGTVISQTIMWASFPRYGKLKKVKPIAIFSHYNGMLFLFIPTIATSIYKLMDKIMLGLIIDMREVGYYESSEKIINLLLTFITAVGTVMLPRISNMAANGKDQEIKKYIDKTMQIMMFIIVAIIFGTIAISKEFIPIFLGKGYEESIPVLDILSLSMFFSAVAQIIRMQFLIPFNHDKEYTFSLVLGACVNVIVNFLAITRYGAIGAAIGTLIAEFTVCLAQLCFVRRYLEIKLYVKQGGFDFFIGVLMFLVVNSVPLFNSTILTMIIKVVIGCTFYGLILLIYFLYIKKRNKEFNVF